MLFNHSHILEIRELGENKIILCYIQVAKRSVKYYHGQSTPHKTHRWMQADDWAKFDANLELMFGNQAVESRLDKMSESSFQLNASIHVRVKKSRIPVDALMRCVLDAPKTLGAALAFEFFIEYKEYEYDVSKSNQLGNMDARITDVIHLSQEEEFQNHEYEPPFVSSQQDGVHVPYTPSPKTKPKLNVKCDYISETPDDDAYSPKPVTIDSSPNSNNESPSQVPAYKPSRMKLEKQGKSVDTQSTIKIIEEKDGYNADEVENDRHKKRNKSKRKKLYVDDKRSRDKQSQSEQTVEAREKDKRREERKISSKHEDDKKHVDKTSKKTQNENDKSATDIKEKSHKNSCFAKDENDSAITSSPTQTEKRKRNLVNYSEDASLIQPRRSSRSPTKPKRFIVQCTDKVEVPTNRSSSRSPKRLKKKRTKVNENLFGSDDEEDEKIDSDFVTNKSTKVKTSHSKIPIEKTSTESVKKKRKHMSPLDCSGEKKSMDTWLSKKLPGKQTSSATTTSSKQKVPKFSTSSTCAAVKKRKSSNDSSPRHISSSPAPLPVVYLTKEEIEENMLKEKLQLEKNSMIKEILKQMAGPTPDKVETLNIKDLSLNDVLNSFEKFKPQLDEIFRRCMKKANQITGYEGINNYMVMSLIDNNKPLEMMNKLQDAYEPDCDNIPTYTSIFANAMMPEWIIRLFMDKHKLTREEAIKHVKAQEEYQLHLKSITENNITD